MDSGNRGGVYIKEKVGTRFWEGAHAEAVRKLFIRYFFVFQLRCGCMDPLDANISKKFASWG